MHLAAASRDQHGGLHRGAERRRHLALVEAAERAGVERFVFFSALGASDAPPHAAARSKALAERWCASRRWPPPSSRRRSIYAPRRALARRARADGAAAGRARCPAWGGRASSRSGRHDAADCVLAVLRRPRHRQRVELAGPETLTHTEMVRLAARGRPVLPVPVPVARAGLRLAETVLRSTAPFTWDEAEILEVPMVAEAGSAEAERLGVTPRRMAEALAR